jgi:hypothetical protein
MGYLSTIGGGFHALGFAMGYRYSAAHYPDSLAGHRSRLNRPRLEYATMFAADF